MRRETQRDRERENEGGMERERELTCKITPEFEKFRGKETSNGCVASA